MTPMTVDAVKDFLHAAPFVPFVIHLPDRPGILVRHPDFVALSPTGRTMTVYKQNSDGFSMIDIPLITELKKQPRPSRRESR